jgi:hypothetical protein
LEELVNLKNYFVALRYEKRRKKMRELKRLRKMLTARLDELAGVRRGRK